MKFFAHCLAFIFGVSNILYAQYPNDNPYLTAYNVEKHWTNEINWKNTIYAPGIKGLIDKKNSIDSLTLHQEMQKLSEKGGGVIYFPEGVFYFSSDVKMLSNVVLRGANLKGTTKAIEDGYKPLTRFEFPQFVAEFSGNGTPHTSIKRIIADNTTSLSNFGLVNLDINRATIEFHAGGYEKKITYQGETMTPKYLHSNVIIYGVRINNSVALSPEIPTKSQVENGFDWLRWPLRYIGNINVNVKANCLLANNRINDDVTDNFSFPVYETDLGRKIGENKVVFSYLDQPGICLNQYKVTLEGNKGDKEYGKWGPYGLYLHVSERSEEFAPEPSPESEPHLFPDGKLEVVDNYVVTTTRNSGILSYAKVNLILEGNKTLQVNEDHYIDHVGKIGLNNYLSSKVDALFEKHHKILDNGDTLKYRLHSPKPDKIKSKYPLILYLHPEDMAGNDNRSQLNLFIPYLCEDKIKSKYPAYILAPQDTDKDISWNAYEPKVTNGRLEGALRVLDSLVLEKNNIDKNRIYVMGLCNGATVALRLGFEHKNKFAAIASLDGTELNLAKEKYLEEEFKIVSETPFWTSYPVDLAHLSLFQGTKINALKIRKAGGEVICKAYPGYSREHILYAYLKDEEFLPWLFSKSRENN